MVTRVRHERASSGRCAFGQKEELVFLGREISEQRNYSDATAQAIDEEVSEIISKAHRTAKEILSKHRPKLDQIAERLIRDETIDEETFNSMFDDFPKVKDDVPTPNGPLADLTARPAVA